QPRRRDEDTAPYLPCRLYQFAREPIEQLRMRWSRALGAEIVFRFHQTAPEVLLPHSIYDYTRCQRIRRVREPSREIQPIGETIRRGLRKCVQNGGNARLNFFAGPGEITF